jgi:regulator of protease activity HflC (stomatin/prohibitin superfamily)
VAKNAGARIARHRRGPAGKTLDDAAGGRGADARLLVGCANGKMETKKMNDPTTFFSWFVFAIFVFLVLSVVLGSFFTVNTAQVAVITRFGRFLRVANPGLNWKWPFIDSVAGRISLRVNQITLTMETKTKDNVFVTIPISVQNRVRPEKAFDAFYKLSNPAEQIQAYVEQVILGHVPGMTLDEVFASQSGIAAAVKQELDADMAGFGYEIVNVLVTDIVPDAKVKSAMNDINAAQREQVAANARGEAEKILVVKRAEAEAESKALQGQGIANQRKAIIEGLQGSIEQFQKVVGGVSTTEVMQLVLVTQYFDTIKSIGESDKTNTLFLTHSPGAVKDITDEIMRSMIVAERAKA